MRRAAGDGGVLDIIEQIVADHHKQRWLRATTWPKKSGKQWRTPGGTPTTRRVPPALDQRIAVRAVHRQLGRPAVAGDVHGAQGRQRIPDRERPPNRAGERGRPEDAALGREHTEGHQTTHMRNDCS